MSALQIDQVGQLQVTYGGHIVNVQSDRDAWREELLARRAAHAQERGEAHTRAWRNGYTALAALGMLIAFTLVLTGWFHALPTPVWLAWIAVAWVLPGLLAQRRYHQCAAQWRYHNEAIHEINKALHVL